MKNNIISKLISIFLLGILTTSLFVPFCISSEKDTEIDVMNKMYLSSVVKYRMDKIIEAAEQKKYIIELDKDAINSLEKVPTETFQDEKEDYEIIKIDKYSNYTNCNLSILDFPSEEGKEINTIPKGIMITIIGTIKDSDYVQIEYNSDDNIKAFVHKSGLSDTKPEPEQTTEEITTTEEIITTTEIVITTEEVIVEYKPSSGCLTPAAGVFNGPSGKETYYNLDMSGVVYLMRNMGYSEEEYPYWVREDGVKMFGPYVMCGASLDIRPKGTILESSLGTAIVVDTGYLVDKYQIDIAVSW